MVIIQGRAGKDSAVRMERGTGYRGGAVMVKEARVGFESREVISSDIEGLDFVSVCATNFDHVMLVGCTGQGSKGRMRRRNIHHEDRSVLVDAQRAQCVSRGVDGGDRILHSEIPEPDFAVSTA